MAAFLFTFFSCQKQATENQTGADMPVMEKLFPLSAIPDIDIRALATEAKRQNEQVNFAADFLKTNGLILWNRAQKTVYSEGVLALIPFALEGKKVVNGFLLSQKSNGGSISFTVYRKDQLVRYGFDANASKPNALKVQSLLNYFNSKLFNINSFTLVDDRQIPAEIRQRHPGTLELTKLKPTFKIQEGGSSARTTGGCYYYTTETEWWYCPNGDGGNGACTGGWYDHSTYENHTFCWDGDSDPYDHDPTDWSGGGGGTNGGSPEITADPNTNYNIDEDNNTVSGFDITSYSQFDINTQTWPTINNVIPKSDFVPLPSRFSNCLTIAKQQIAKKNYQISDYGAAGQTFQIYKTATGADINQAKSAVSYLIYALQNGIPVIAGVDNRAGSPNSQTDNSTDHFIVIVGMGTDSQGNYFRFYDNATSFSSTGTHDNNKLYYDSTTGLIKGKSQTSYATSQPDLHDYIVTMIRKSKPI